MRKCENEGKVKRENSRENYRAISSRVAKALAIRDGLKLGMTMGLQWVVIEYDNVEAIVKNWVDS